MDKIVKMSTYDVYFVNLVTSKITYYFLPLLYLIAYSLTLHKHPLRVSDIPGGTFPSADTVFPV